MKEILCVVDLSESSGKVLDVAARIAIACRAHLNVLYPYRLIDYNHHGDMPSLKQRLESQAKEKFQQLKSKLVHLAEISCDFQPEIGFMSDRISAHLRRNSVDLVVIGQDQIETSNDIRTLDLQHMIRSTQLPFVIVPAEVPAVAKA